jgi:hypothetical protein
MIITSEIFDFLYQMGVTPNAWYVLYATHSKTYLPDYVNIPIEQRKLCAQGFLTEASTDLGKLYPLSKQGLELLRTVEDKINRVRKIRKNQVTYPEWEADIKAFVQLFPTGNQGSQPIRTTPKILFDRFKWFFATFPEFNWETVLEATRAYISYQETSREGLRYVSTAKNFIKKEDKNRNVNSSLADWCTKLESGEVDEAPAPVIFFAANIV